MKRIIFLISFLMIITTIISCNESTKPETKIVSPEEMQTLLQLDNIQLVDVRTPKEYKGGFIENAQNIDFRSDTFTEDIKKLDKDKPIIIYCHSGGRSAKCAKKMLEAGFTKVYDLEGGISKWKLEGYKIKL